MPLRVLFLDDDPDRTRSFVSRVGSHGLHLVTVETVSDCIEHLAASRWDLVLLDHDLGGEVFVESARADTGAEVVRWLRDNPGEHGSFIVHSMNAVGAASMFFDLREMGYRVAQAAYGSSDFWRIVGAELRIRTTSRSDRKSLGGRIAAYIRSIKTGRR